MIKVGIVGNCGHGVQALAQLSGIKEVNLCAYAPGYAEENPERLTAAFKQYSLTPAYYDDYKALVDNARPDVLIVDGLFCDHYKMSLYALEHGAHVFCEKPLALDLSELDNLADAAARNALNIWAMQTLRYEPGVFTAHKIVESGAIGRIRMVNGQKSYRMGRRAFYYHNRETFGGITPWVAIHAIDAIMFLCKNPFLEVYSHHEQGGGPGDMETTSISLFKLDDGVIAHVNSDFLRPGTAATHDDDRIRIVGSKGVLEYINHKLYLINEDNDGSHEYPTETPPSLFNDFIDTVFHGHKGLLSTEDSIASTRYALLARKSADTNTVICINT